MRDREWGSCAVAGGIIGAAVGGITGGTLVNNVEPDPSDGERGGAIAGGIIGGAAVGALLGHMICDPVKEAPPPPPPPPPAPPAKGTKIANIPGANFEFNKYNLTAEGKAKIHEASNLLKQYPNLRVAVEGHTDSIGSEAYNMRLSERRAQTVADVLVADGISASRLDVRGFGKTKPIADNKTAAGRAENRRVEIVAE